MNQTNPQEEIAYIKQIIQDSRRIIIEDGIGFIFWGILIIVGLLLTYFAIIFGFNQSLNWLWPVLIGFGWIVSIIGEMRREKKSKVSTFAGKILGAVWISSGIAMTILGFVGSATGAYHSVYINAVISVVLGIAYFVSGAVYNYRWITYLSIGWWAGAIVIFIWPYLYTLLLMAGMMFFFQTVPGLILYRKYKNEIKAQADE